MQGYYPISNGGGGGQGYYPPPAGFDGYPQPGFGGLPSPGQPYPLPLPTGMGAVGGWAEDPVEQDENHLQGEAEATSEGTGAEGAPQQAPPAPTAVAA